MEPACHRNIGLRLEFILFIIPPIELPTFLRHILDRIVRSRTPRPEINRLIVVIVLYPESEPLKPILPGRNGDVEIDDAVLEMQPHRVSNTSRFIIGNVP